MHQPGPAAQARTEKRAGPQKRHKVSGNRPRAQRRLLLIKQRKFHKAEAVFFDAAFFYELQYPSQAR
jgi:hypothetical protein